MISEQLKSIIRDGEGLTVEFKECRYQVNRDVYETVCAFLNRSGGHIVLGVQDNGNITGIDEDALPQIKKDLVTALNNSQKINPPLYILPEEVTINGKKLLILESPRVLRFTAAMEKYLTGMKRVTSISPIIRM